MASVMAALSEPDPQVKAVLDALFSDPDDALRLAEAALRAAGGDRGAAAAARRALSSVHLQKGDSGAAVEAADEAFAAFRDLKDTPGQASALRALVEARLYDGRPELAASVVASASQRFEADKDDLGLAFSLLLEAEIKTAQEDYEVGATKASESLAAVRKLGAKDRGAAVGGLLLRLAEFQTSVWKLEGAAEAADEALQVFRGLPGGAGKAGEGAALHAVALVRAAEQRYADALTSADGALAIFKSLGDKAAQSAVLRTKINAYLSDKRPSEARRSASEAVEVFRVDKDTKGEAGAQLLVAEVCIQTLHADAADVAATEAYELYKGLGNRHGQAAALAAIAASDADGDSGRAIWAAGARAALWREAGDRYQEADALLALANAHVARIAKKIARCSLAPADDSIGALKAAKEAFAIFDATSFYDGMENARRAVAQVLSYNNVAAEVVASLPNPEEVFQAVMEGKYSSSKNALPQTPAYTKNLKIEEIVPSAKQLERGKFAWNNPLAGYSYTLIWQPAKDRQVRNRRPRGSYDIMTLNTGTKTSAVPTALQARSNDAADRTEPLVVYMVSTDAKTNYATTMMTAVQTIGAMITAKLQRLTILQFDESHFDWTDTKVRQCNLYPVLLGLLRSARIEAPNVTIGFVGGDMASWISNPAPMIESVFDTVESDESEVIYKRGDAFAPLLVHKPLDDPVQFVKPKKKAWGASVK